MPTPARLLLEHERVEALDVLRPERRRRLVEEQHLRPGEQRLDDLEELPLGRARASRWAPSPGCRGRTRERLLPPTPPCARTSAVHRRARRGRGSRPPTGRGRASRSGTRCRARAGAPRRGMAREAAPADLDGSLVGSEEAAGDPEQCRFPGPVLPDERVDLARAAVDADVAERLHRSERLRHAAKGQHDGGHGPGIRHCLDSASRARSSYGYIWCSRLSGMSDVAEASCG